MQSVNIHTQQQLFEQDLYNRQNQLQSIYAQRKLNSQVLSEKKKLHKMLFNKSELPKLIPQNYQQDVKDTLRKIVKKDSQNFQNSSQTLQSSLDGNKVSDKAQQAQNEKQQISKSIPKQINDRNKRIFGGLTNYLKKAGAHLESKQQKQKTQHSQQVMNKVRSRQLQQRQHLQQQKKQQLQIQIQKLQQQKSLSEKIFNSKQNQVLSLIVKKHFNVLEQFSMTKTEPRIFWKPKKPLEDTETVQKIKQYQSNHLKSIEKEILQKINSYENAFNHGKYMTQNQRQYCGNFIRRMYKNHHSFILTKSEPSVFWRPNKNMQSMKALKIDTIQRLGEIQKSLLQKNEEFYKKLQTSQIQQHHHNQFEADIYQQGPQHQSNI